MTVIKINLNGDPRQLRDVAELLLKYASDPRQEPLPLRYAVTEPLVTPEGWAPSIEVPGAIVPASPPNEAGDLDADGFPWDDRIHASSKAKNADGTWRQRRNLDPAIREHVEGELMDRGFGRKVPPPVPVPVPAPPAEVAVVPTPVPVPAPPAEVSVAVVPVPVPAPPAEVAVAAVPVPTMTFPELMTRITTAVSKGDLTMPEIPAILTSLGVNGGLPGLVSAPEMIPVVAAALGVSDG